VKKIKQWCINHHYEYVAFPAGDDHYQLYTIKGTIMKLFRRERVPVGTIIYQYAKILANTGTL
jgi:hypothetical protein